MTQLSPPGLFRSFFIIICFFAKYNLSLGNAALTSKLIIEISIWSFWFFWGTLSLYILKAQYPPTCPFSFFLLFWCHFCFCATPFPSCIIQTWFGTHFHLCILPPAPASMPPEASGVSAPCSAAPSFGDVPMSPVSGRSYGLSVSDNNASSMPGSYGWTGVPGYTHASLLAPDLDPMPVQYPFRFPGTFIGKNFLSLIIETFLNAIRQRREKRVADCSTFFPWNSNSCSAARPGPWNCLPVLSDLLIYIFTHNYSIYPEGNSMGNHRESG